MKERILGKGLVVGVILLFIGISIQPAFAINSISSDNEEDCSICPKVSKQHLVRLKSLINRAESLNNKLLVMSKLYPEVAEKYQELSDRIITIKEMNKELKPDRKYPIICTILLIIWLPVSFILAYIIFMWLIFWVFPIINSIFKFIIDILTRIEQNIEYLFLNKLNCHNLFFN